MERTYALTRMSKALCWLQIALSSAGLVFLVGIVSRISRRWILGHYANGPCPLAFGILFLILLAVLAVFSIRSSWRELSFRLTLRDEALQVGDVVVPWESITRVFGFYSLGLAFSLRTAEGRRFLVPRVEQADLIEDLIRGRVVDGVVADESPSLERLMRYDVSRKAKMRFELVSVVFWCGCIAGFGVWRFCSVDTDVWMPAVLAAIASLFLATWSWSRAHFSVAVFGKAIRVGDSIAKWDQIKAVESSGKLGVAFYLEKHDGDKMRVFSSLGNAGELLDVVKERLAQVNA